MVEEYLTHFVNLDEEDDLEAPLIDDEIEEEDKDAEEDKDDLLDPDPIEEDI